jgi:hypothetical protein
MLGSPIPTHAILEGRMDPGGKTVFEPANQFRSSTLMVTIHRVLDGRKARDEHARQLVVSLDALATRLPERYPLTLNELPGPNGPLMVRQGASAGDPIQRANFRSVVQYRGDLLASLEALREASRNPLVLVAGQPTRTAATNQFLQDEMTRTEVVLKQVNAMLAEQTPLLREAADYAAATQE